MMSEGRTAGLKNDSSPARKEQKVMQIIQKREIPVKPVWTAANFSIQEELVWYAETGPAQGSNYKIRIRQ